MKLLAVDVGNTEIKRAVIQHGEVSHLRRDPTREIDRVSKEIAAARLPVALSSVRQQATELIKDALSKKDGELVMEVDHQIEEPVSGFYKGMGADRIADISAAWSKHEGKPVMVIGLGTATTCTAASSAGIFKGGFITLGIGATAASLTDALPELPTIDPKVARSLEPGFDAYSSICRGTLAGHVGILRQWMYLFRQELGSDLIVIATGGWSETVIPFCPGINEVDPNLTLKGIWTVTKASGWTSFS